MPGTRQAGPHNRDRRPTLRGSTVTQRWARADSALWRHSLGDLVALGEGEPVRLNATSATLTSATLWDCLAQPAATAELTAALAERFGTEPDETRAQVEAVLHHLAEFGLVTKQ